MSQQPLSMLTRLRLIEARLEHIESRLGIPPLEAAEPETPPAPHPPTRREPAQAPPPPTQLIAEPPEQRIVKTREMIPRREPEAERPSLEQFIGGRVFAIAGALIVVLGVTFFIKLAWDNGWIALSPAGRCFSAAVFGLALLAGAEFARRKINALTAVGLNIAGLSTLIITALVALTRFDLISTPLAFTFLAGTGVLGVIIAVRARYVSVAGFSVACGYLATYLFMLDGLARPGLVIPYCLALLAGALVASSFKALRFSALGTIAWCFHLPVSATWLLALVRHHEYWSLLLVTGTWALTNASLIFRAATSTEEPASTRRATVPFAASVVVGAWATLLGLVCMVELDRSLDWIVPAAFGVGSLAVAQVFSGTLRSLRDAPETQLERVALAHVAQAGALLLLTVALATTQWLTVTCWLALGAGAMVARRLTGAHRLAPFGLITLAIGLAHTALLTPWTPDAATPHVELGELFLTRGSLMLALNALAWGVVAWSCRTKQPALACLVIAAGLFGLTVVNSMTPASWVAGAWIALALLAGAIGAAMRLVPFTTLALGVLGASLVPWAKAHFSDTPWQTSDAPVALHPGLLTSLVVAALAGAVAWVHHRAVPREDEDGRATLVAAPAALATLLVLFTTSLEVARGAEIIADSEQTQRAVLSIWWALFAIPLLVIGFLKRLTPVRTAALGLIARAAGKALIYDLFQVQTAWRVVIFLGLGLLMLAIALIYGRLSARASAGDHPVVHEPDRNEPEPHGPHPDLHPEREPDA